MEKNKIERRGGFRPNAGRPVIAGLNRKISTSVSLSQDVVQRLREDKISPSMLVELLLRKHYGLGDK